MKCDGCTLCCKLLRIPWMDSPEGEYCRECKPNVGCQIWENRPEGCRSYGCSYYNVEGNIDIELRPDHCYVVFEKATDTIFFGTIDPMVISLPETVIKQIKSFLKKGYSVVLKHLAFPEACVINTEDRTAEDVWKELKEAAKKFYGNSSL